MTTEVTQEQSDQELINACLNNSVSAWEILIKRYRPLIYSIPKKYGCADQDTADIFQATCVILLEKLADLRDQERFRSWLIITVSRLCWRWRARTRARQEIPLIYDLDNDEETDWQLTAPDARIDEQLIELERRFLIQRVYAQLPLRCQQLLGYLFFREPPANYREIAEEIGIAPDSIGPTRCRCLEKFKQLYDRAEKRGSFSGENL